jgi:2-oxoglutarate ferredoxin oxidoreductase subunit beta
MTATLRPPQAAPLAPKHYASDQEVRWCPGCGDYAILKAAQKTLADVGARREMTVFVSGIGCSSTPTGSTRFTGGRRRWRQG